MTTINESIHIINRAVDSATGVVRAQFQAEGDATEWYKFRGDLTIVCVGPVDAATIAVFVSDIDPTADGFPGGSELDDATGDPAEGGIAFQVPGNPGAYRWARLVCQATFGPAADVVNRTLDSLTATINGLQAYPAHDFAPGTESVPLVHATRLTDNDMVVTAITPGVAGNDIAVAEDLTNGGWDGGGVALANGADAVEAEGTLTLDSAVEEDDTVTIGEIVYTFKDAITEASPAYDVLIGADTEAARDNLLDAIAAVGLPSAAVLTFTVNAVEGDTIRLGDYVYTFKEAVAEPFEVLIGATASDTLDNLIAAVLATADAGTLYGNNTVPNPWAVAAAGASDTVDFESVGSGYLANQIKTLSYQRALGTLTFTPGTFTTQVIQIGGVYYQYAADPTSDPDASGLVANPWQVDVGATATISLDNLLKAINRTGTPGVTYSYYTRAHPTVEALDSDATTLNVRARSYGPAGDSLSTTVPSGAGLAWGATTLLGNVFGGAVMAGATGAGVNYGVDTEAHPLVTAAAVSTNALTATAVTAGVAGNDIVTEDTLTDVAATGTLTFTPGTITTQVIQLGGVYYVFAADPTSEAGAAGTEADPWQVDVGVDDTTSLANLAAAINADGTAGVTYSTALTANPLAASTASDATTVDVEAIVPGAAGNSISSTVPVGAGFAWGATTLEGGEGGWEAATLEDGADAVAASLELTMSGAFEDGDTVTVDEVVYTIKTALTPTAGEVMIAGTKADVTLSGEVTPNYG